MKMASRKTKFNDQWLEPTINPEFVEWLKKAEDPFHAYCVVCKRTFSLGNMGRKAVVIHSSGKQHKQLLKIRSANTSLSSFFSVGASSSKHVVESASKEQPSSSEHVTNTMTPQPQQSSRSPAEGLHSFLFRDEVTKSEVLWALSVVQHNMSFRSCDGISETFKTMFPDSSIASKFSMGSTKCSYLITHGLAPYFELMLKDQLRECEDIVVCFDETLNKVVQKGQMDLFIRYYDVNVNRVCTRYYNSVFLGHSTAIDLLDSFNTGLAPLPRKNILQVSMDGPSVNLSFIQKLDAKMREDNPDGKCLVNIGVCGLHVVNGAVKSGLQSAGWELHIFLRDIFFLFQDSPARRADFTAITGCNIFPLQHCSVRWLENVVCVERILEILGSIKEFMKKSKTLKSKPYKVVAEHVSDKFIKCKLSFFKTICSECQPFLTHFQSASPLAPYLFSKLHNLMRSLMSRLIQPSKVQSAHTVSALMSLDLNEAVNLLPVDKVDVCFQTQKFLKEVHATELELLQFRKECQTFLRTTVEKLKERSPLRYKVVRGLSSLDPSVILNQSQVGCTRFKCLLHCLFEANRIPEDLAENAKREYSLLCEDARTSFSQSFETYLQDKQGIARLDDFYASLLSNNQKYSSLWKVVKLSLIFSHGNATVEGGFSINKSALIENQCEHTIIALRRVHDAIINSKGIHSIVITQKMLTYARSARRRYEDYLDTQRNVKKIEENNSATKRKAMYEIKKLEDEQKKLREKSEMEQDELSQKIKLLRKLQN